MSEQKDKLREKIERILDGLLFSPGESKDGYTYNLTECIDQMEALIEPLKEEVKKQEREWRLPVIKHLAEHRNECSRCNILWQALGEKC